MTNKNYIKGVKKERKLVNEARLNGHIAFRSAGSHSPIDVVIIDFLKDQLLLIQCKSGAYAESERRRLNDTYKFLNKKFDVSFHVV